MMATMMRVRPSFDFFLLRSPDISPSFADDKPDFPAAGGAVHIPSCRCDEPAVEKTVTKESDNKGRKFFTCSKGQDGGCGFFEWNENGGGVGGDGGRIVPQKRPLGNSASGNVRPFSFYLCLKSCSDAISCFLCRQQQQQLRNRAPRRRDNEEDDEGAPRRCDCDLTPAERTVTKEGSSRVVFLVARAGSPTIFS